MELNNTRMPPKASKQQWKFSLIYSIWFIAAIWFLRTSFSPPEPRDVSYGDFLTEVKAGHLEDIRITEHQLVGTLKKEQAKEKGKKAPENSQIFRTRIPGWDAGLARYLKTPFAQDKKSFSEHTPEQSDAEARHIIDWQYERVCSTLMRGRRELNPIAGTLLKKETLEELEKLLAEPKPEEAARA